MMETQSAEQMTVTDMQAGTGPTPGRIQRQLSWVQAGMESA